LLKGDATVTIVGPAGREFGVLKSGPKAGMAVGITELDTFSLDVTYKIITKDTLPQIDLTKIIWYWQEWRTFTHFP
jgi:hypothetical protein